MRMNEVRYPEGTPVTGYGPGFFRVGSEVMNGGVLILPGGVFPWAGLDDLAPILAQIGSLDVLFVGTGREIAHLPAAMREALEAAGVGVEAMNSPAACRTYNVLLSEGRRIGLAALPVW